MSVVQKKEFTKNGAAKYQIDGSWYFVSRGIQTDGLEPGASINFKWEEFGDDRGRGRPRTITSWARAAQQNARSSNGTAASVSTITDVDVLRSVSNVVGSACAAGTVKTPEELEKWFCAAWAGFTRRQKSATGADPDFDDQIPYNREPGSDDF